MLTAPRRRTTEGTAWWLLRSNSAMSGGRAIRALSRFRCAPPRKRTSSPSATDMLAWWGRDQKPHQRIEFPAAALSLTGRIESQTRLKSADRNTACHLLPNPPDCGLALAIAQPLGAAALGSPRHLQAVQRHAAALKDTVEIHLRPAHRRMRQGSFSRTPVMPPRPYAPPGNTAYNTAVPRRYVARLAGGARRPSMLYKHAHGVELRRLAHDYV